MDDLQRKTPSRAPTSHLEAATVFAVGFALAAGIIFINPIIFGGDTLNRLVYRNKLVMGHQLPMLQVLILAVTKISANPTLVRYLDAVIGAIAGVGFYWVVVDLFGKKWALPAALLFATNPFFLALSTVPYQESLMLAGLVFAFHFFYRERWLASSLALAIACLTRYEAWAAGPVLALAYVLRKDRSVVGWLRGALTFGWMPALWILANRGLSSSGHFVVESSFSIWRLQRYVYLGWITFRNTQLPVVALAAVGVWRLYKDRSLIDWRLWVQIAFVGLFLLAIPFSAHGVLPDPERYVTAREAYIPIYCLLLLATLGLAQWPRWTSAIVGLSIVLGAAGAYWYVWQETHRPDVQLAYRLAKYLDSSLQSGQRALVLVQPVNQEVAESYLEKVRKTSGEDAERRARIEMQEFGTAGTDYERVLAHSRLGRDRLLSAPSACAEWVGVWSDYPDAVRELALGQQVQVLRSGSMSVTILQRRCGER
jgi:hypothetical protein